MHGCHVNFTALFSGRFTSKRAASRARSNLLPASLSSADGETRISRPSHAMLSGDAPARDAPAQGWMPPPPRSGTASMIALPSVWFGGGAHAPPALFEGVRRCTQIPLCRCACVTRLPLQCAGRTARLPKCLRQHCTDRAHFRCDEWGKGAHTLRIAGTSSRTASSAPSTLP